MFIVFEGPEGCGKSTQARLADMALRERGFDTVLTKEPGGTPLGDKIRDIILNSTDRMDIQAELLLYMASRAQIMDETIQPALQANKIVLCERFLSSSRVYQGIAGGADMDVIDYIGTFATLGVDPDLTIVIDIDAEIGLGRTGSPDRIESRGAEYHKRVRKGFLALAELDSDQFTVIDGHQDVETVHAAVMETIRGKMEEMEIEPGSAE